MHVYMDGNTRTLALAHTCFYVDVGICTQKNDKFKMKTFFLAVENLFKNEVYL